MTVTFAVACPAVNEAPLQVTIYVVVDLGATETLPDIAPPVLKFVPVHDVPFEDQVSLEVFPVVIVIGLALITAKVLTAYIGLIV